MAQGGNPAGKKPPSAAGEAHDRILEVLIKFMSQGSAMATIERAGASSGLDVRRLEPADASAFFSAVERAAAAMLDRKSQALLHGELSFELTISIGKSSPSALPATQSFDVRGELDITAVRARAQELVTALGGRSYDAVRTMTLVSELARNIVRYTSGGRVELTPRQSPRSLVVCAADHGPGIPNLDEIMAGRYRSKTGLGKGLLGAKRLADRFEIQTGSAGTRIEVEVRL